jgi:hypothetical protein
LLRYANISEILQSKKGANHKAFVSMKRPRIGKIKAIFFHFTVSPASLILLKRPYNSRNVKMLKQEGHFLMR